MAPLEVKNKIEMKKILMDQIKIKIKIKLIKFCSLKFRRKII
jgi:hypothetical protein